MPARVYPDELLDRAASLREEGMTYDAIARELSMSASAVRWHCLRLGAFSPRTVAGGCGRAGPMVTKRGDHMVRRFSDEEDRQLLEMDKAGARVCDMARALDRKPNSVRGRLMTLARHEALAELEQEHAA